MITYELFRAKLAAQNILKKDFMDKTGISKGTMNKLRNDQYVSLEVIDRICTELKCDINNVLTFRHGFQDKKKKK